MIFLSNEWISRLLLKLEIFRESLFPRVALLPYATVNIVMPCLGTLNLGTQIRVIEKDIKKKKKKIAVCDIAKWKNQKVFGFWK